ncbi:MAG: hypothetical protein JWO83_203 [Caulobacteraceae bacterium]|nr:hypothetical protein [Caulobacteraceae bacterium]
MMRGEIMGRGFSGVVQEKQGWRGGRSRNVRQRPSRKKGRSRPVLGGTGQSPRLPPAKQITKARRLQWHFPRSPQFFGTSRLAATLYFRSFSVEAFRWLSRPSAPPVATGWAKSARRVVSWLTPS